MERALRFLVADDNADLRDVLERMIVRTGHQPESVADGLEATQALAERRYDVLLLDLDMPKMTGDEVIDWLRVHPDRAAGMRVVVVTAWGGDRRGRLQELGITKVLAKPFRLQDVTNLVTEIVGEAAADGGTSPP